MLIRENITKINNEWLKIANKQEKEKYDKNATLSIKCLQVYEHYLKEKNYVWTNGYFGSEHQLKSMNLLSLGLSMHERHIIKS